MRLVMLLLLSVSSAQAASVAGANGVPIQYERYGSGDSTIVFVHGWTCDRSYWREQIDAFAADHTVIAIDLAGHGQSGDGRDDWSIAAFGEDVAAVVAAEDVANFILVGHSMGGPVVIEAALALDGRVEQVIAVGVVE